VLSAGAANRERRVDQGEVAEALRRSVAPMQRDGARGSRLCATPQEVNQRARSVKTLASLAASIPIDEGGMSEIIGASGAIPFVDRLGRAFVRIITMSVSAAAP
jgi:hypothetical protein